MTVAYTAVVGAHWVRIRTDRYLYDGRRVAAISTVVQTDHSDFRGARDYVEEFVDASAVSHGDAADRLYFHRMNVVVAEIRDIEPVPPPPSTQWVPLPGTASTEEEDRQFLQHLKIEAPLTPAETVAVCAKIMQRRF